MYEKKKNTCYCPLTNGFNIVIGQTFLIGFGGKKAETVETETVKDFIKVTFRWSKVSIVEKI
jgi:hypothetical protein